MKLLVAFVTFGLIMGGWWLLQRNEAQQAASAPLPGAGGAQGRCALWFIGSSSIHRWRTLERDMTPWIAHNRGVDGATFAELAPRFVADPQRIAPDAIILYAGENDIAGGGTARQAIGDLKRMLDDKTRKFGATPTLILSMKPSPTRWRIFAELGRYNAAARALADRRGDLIYVDIVPKLLINGRPGDFYVADGIHMNEAGYRIWAEAVRRALGRALPDREVRACDPAFAGPAAIHATP